MPERASFLIAIVARSDARSGRPTDDRPDERAPEERLTRRVAGRRASPERAGGRRVRRRGPGDHADRGPPLVAHSGRRCVSWDDDEGRAPTPTRLPGPMTAGVPTTAPPEIRLVDLAKRFGEVRAVDDVSLDIRAGEFFSLLGPRAAARRRPSG